MPLAEVSRRTNTVARRVDAVQLKIDRIKDGGDIRTLDLFAGCGGLSLGFDAAGFSIIGAVEIDPQAAESHATNFHPELLGKSKALAQDLTKTTPREVVAELQLGRSVVAAVDVIIGGPPCQAFARVGRAKLREVDEHPEAFLRDNRANLYLQYLRFVRDMCPLAILMENVPDALNFGGHNICEEMCEVLAADGYICGYTMLNAAFYGVPQMRERMFLLAYRSELESLIEFPDPTHFVQLPPGYLGTRAVALKSLCESGSDHYFLAAPTPTETLSRAISAKDAIGDLPVILGHLDGTIKRGARRFDECIPYPQSQRLSSFARLMRTWPGFEAGDGVVDHVIRLLPRDYQIFREMQAGDQYPQAHKVAHRIFDRCISQLSRVGKSPTPGTKEYERLKSEIVPPYDPCKFPNKWRKMESDLPSRTLLAHLGKDSYSHIHYDSSQARTISVREAARLQSFPDGFRFVGTMNPAFRQIGNAVPPLLANAMAHVVLSALGRNANRPRLASRLSCTTRQECDAATRQP